MNILTQPAQPTHAVQLSHSYDNRFPSMEATPPFEGYPQPSLKTLQMTNFSAMHSKQTYDVHATIRHESMVSPQNPGIQRLSSQRWVMKVLGRPNVEASNRCTVKVRCLVRDVSSSARPTKYRRLILSLAITPCTRRRHASIRSFSCSMDKYR
jgi:hypothetical protein